MARRSTGTNEWPKTVQTKMRPYEDVQVGREEYTDLERLGLLKGQDTDTPGSVSPAPDNE